MDQLKLSKDNFFIPSSVMTTNRLFMERNNINVRYGQKIVKLEKVQGRFPLWVKTIALMKTQASNLVKRQFLILFPYSYALRGWNFRGT